MSRVNIVNRNAAALKAGIIAPRDFHPGHARALHRPDSATAARRSDLPAIFKRPGGNAAPGGTHGLETAAGRIRTAATAIIIIATTAAVVVRRHRHQPVSRVWG